MYKPSKSIKCFGLTLSPVALVLLLASCGGLLQVFSCITGLSPRLILSTANRTYGTQFAVAEWSSPTIGSYWNAGTRSFLWGTKGKARAAQTIHAGLFGISGFRYLEEEPKRKTSPAAKLQNTVGSDIYFVGAPENSLTVLNSETAAQLGVIPVGTDPRWIEVSPDQSKAYISNFGSDSITVIDTATRSADQTIDLAAGSSPMGLAPSPDGTRVYVVNSNMNSLSVVDVDEGVVVATFDAGDGATHVAVSPDGQLAYVTNQNAGTVSVFDTLSMDLVTTISGIPGATSVTFESHGLKAYVTGSSSGSGKLYVISTTDHTVGGTVSVGSDPVSVRLSPYGNFLFVANRDSGSISIVDVRTETVLETVPVGQSPVDVAAVL